jgi:hypothetical protein
MAGLVLAMTARLALCSPKRDARDKPAHDSGDFLFLDRFAIWPNGEMGCGELRSSREFVPLRGAGQTKQS